MKLCDTKVGQIVVDIYGNRYRVTDVTHEKDAHRQPVRLLCVQHLGGESYYTKSLSESTEYKFNLADEWWIKEDELCDFTIISDMKMKFADLEVGQIVVDRHGNEYEVLCSTRIPYDVKLKCTKFVKQVEVSKDNFLTTKCQVVHVLNKEYLEEHFDVDTSKIPYITADALTPKAEYVLNEQNINDRLGDILDKADRLDNSGENAYYLRQAICEFRDDLLEAVKQIENQK